MKMQPMSPYAQSKLYHELVDFNYFELVQTFIYYMNTMTMSCISTASVNQAFQYIIMHCDIIVPVYDIVHTRH